MGLILSWFKGGSAEQPALQDVTVETQVKTEDAVITKSVLVEQTNGSPQVEPAPLINDGALEAVSAGVTNSAPIAEQSGSLPLDTLNALSESLGSAEPLPEPAPIAPADIVSPCLETLDQLDGDLAAPAEAEETDVPADQTSVDGVASCGLSATIPSDIAAALVEDAPAIPDMSGNMVQAQS